jgi:YjbE family integral membrane protein
MGIELTPAFWSGLFQIILVNIVLSGDNALVIALACRNLQKKHQKPAILIGSAGAIILRIIFVLIVDQLLQIGYLKLIGGLLLLWIGVKLVQGEDEHGDGVKASGSLWGAIRTIIIADAVMSLDNVIAIAASAEVAAARVDLAHAAGIKTTLIIFGLATSVPLIVAGSAILMALLERYRVLVWGGGALLGWVAGDIMATDPGLVGVFSEATLHTLHIWGGPVGGLIVLGAGYFIVGRHRSLKLDEILAGVALVVWIVVDRISESVMGANADPLKIWGIRGVLLLLMIGAYILARKQWHVEEQEV